MATQADMIVRIDFRPKFAGDLLERANEVVETALQNGVKDRALRQAVIRLAAVLSAIEVEEEGQES